MTDQAPDPPLEEGERVLWRGRPDPDRIFTRWDAFWVPFSIAWFAFAVFWVAVVSTRVPLWAGMAAGSPFLLFGAYGLVGRFVVKSRAARRTTYILTDRRAIVSGRRTREVRLEGRVAQARSSGRGSHLDVVFRSSTSAFKAIRLSLYESYRNTGLDSFLTQTEWVLGVPPSLAFYDVADVEGLRTALAQRFPKVTTRSLA
jgi:hypothetical protein